mmetsp:Transcript_22718/g.41669  ORF Transcript_22718/g.41669 Transcript_22718/m.41669 type:complete len:102 (+) Transcript_22718:472-777(+)
MQLLRGSTIPAHLTPPLRAAAVVWCFVLWLLYPKGLRSPLVICRFNSWTWMPLNDARDCKEAAASIAGALVVLKRAWRQLVMRSSRGRNVGGPTGRQPDRP